jgi:hypothetical protein
MVLPKNGLIKRLKTFTRKTKHYGNENFVLKRVMFTVHSSNLHSISVGELDLSHLFRSAEYARLGMIKGIQWPLPVRRIKYTIAVSGVQRTSQKTSAERKKKNSGAFA